MEDPCGSAVLSPRRQMLPLTQRAPMAALPRIQGKRVGEARLGMNAVSELGAPPFKSSAVVHTQSVHNIMCTHTHSPHF